MNRLIPISLAVAFAACGSSAPVTSPRVASTTSSGASPSYSASSASSATAPSTASSRDSLLTGLEGYQLEEAKACLGDAPTASLCASCARDGVAKKAYARSFACAKSGCAQKNLETCRYVAELTITGRGTPQDVQAGLKIWNDLCEQERSLKDCEELALVFHGGIGTSNELLREVYKRVEPDGKKESFYVNKQCDLGWEGACTSLGRKH